jgi:hypothetical protein
LEPDELDWQADRVAPSIRRAVFDSFIVLQHQTEMVCLSAQS